MNDEIEAINKELAENAIPDVYYISLLNTKIGILEDRIEDVLLYADGVKFEMEKMAKEKDAEIYRLKKLLKTCKVEMNKYKFPTMLPIIKEINYVLRSKHVRSS